MTDEHIALLQRIEQCAPDLASQVRELIGKVEAVEAMPSFGKLMKGRYTDGRPVWIYDTSFEFGVQVNTGATPWEALNNGK